MKEIEALAIQLMKQHGLSNWNFGWNNTRGSFGKCIHRTHTIELSIITTPLRTREEVVNTILHEIAHALVGSGNGHNHIWKRKAIEIGCNGERCGSSVGIDKTQLAGTKWVATCANGHVHVHFRSSKKQVSCGRCSNKFDMRYLLMFTKQA